MQRRRNIWRGCLPMVMTGLGIPVVASVAIADSVPESIRIQEKAEKAYEAAPVVPIERGNAHHREGQKDDMGGDDVTPVPRMPPPRTEHPDSSR